MLDTQWNAYLLEIGPVEVLVTFCMCFASLCQQKQTFWLSAQFPTFEKIYSAMENLWYSKDAWYEVKAR